MPSISVNDDSENALLRVERLKKYFPITAGVLKRKIGDVKAVDEISFSVNQGETFGLIGESGSGKTTVGKTIIRIYNPTEGRIFFRGSDISHAGRDRVKGFRREMQMVYQDPTSSLNPRRKVQDILLEPLIAHRVDINIERRKKVEELIELVRLSKSYLHKYRHELSGGEKQRINIARALILSPRFVVLDEPTSSLDVSVQAKIILLLRDLQKELDLTYLFISHDLSLVRNISHRVGVMYLGQLVEVAATNELYKNSFHPYTQALLSAIPTISDEEEQLKQVEITLRGEIPSPASPPRGCRFHTRCFKKKEICALQEPEIVKIRGHHFVKCHLYSKREQ